MTGHTNWRTPRDTVSEKTYLNNINHWVCTDREGHLGILFNVGCQIVKYRLSAWADGVKAANRREKPVCRVCCFAHPETSTAVSLSSTMHKTRQLIIILQNNRFAQKGLHKTIASQIHTGVLEMFESQPSFCQYLL